MDAGNGQLRGARGEGRGARGEGRGARGEGRRATGDGRRARGDGPARPAMGDVVERGAGMGDVVEWDAGEVRLAPSYGFFKGGVYLPTNHRATFGKRRLIA